MMGLAISSLWGKPINHSFPFRLSILMAQHYTQKPEGEIFIIHTTYCTEPKLKPFFKNCQLRLVTNIQEINQHTNNYKEATKNLQKVPLVRYIKIRDKSTMKPLKNL